MHKSLGLIVVMCLTPGLAWGQEAIAGRVVRQNFAPASEKPGGVLDIGAFAGATPPAGAEKFELSVSGARFEGDPCPVASRPRA